MIVQKELACWIYYEDIKYYCFGCVEKRMEEINNNKEFADQIDYENGDRCVYMRDYADEKDDVVCCKCSAPLFSLGSDAN